VRSEKPDNISCFGFDDGCISEGERDKKGRMKTGDIKKCCTTGKSFCLWLQSGIPTKLK